MQIMLVDDDMDDIDLFQEALVEVKPDAGFIVSRTGLDLFSKLRKDRPSVIFLDLNMPEMNGWECLMILKKDEMLKSIPVIIYTTSASIRDFNISKDLGAFRTVTKPDRFQDLLKILSEIIEEIENR